MTMFVGIGIILLVLGGILAFAIRDNIENVDLIMVGWILIAGGGLSLIVGAIQGLGLMSMRSTRTQTERQVSSDGNRSVEETRIE